MNAPTTVTFSLPAEDLALLVAHLKRHLTEVDQELIRTDNPTLQHAIARELKALERVMARLEAAAK